MARRLNMAILAAILMAALLQSSEAQTTHNVGGSIGWTVPNGGAAAYSSWAANQTFTVGDTLVFTFPTGIHDVAQVTQAEYDACNSTSPILFESTGPANVTLKSTGAHYFICNFTGHCSGGQKLMVNVSAAASSPAPQPSSPSPTSTTPASAPSPTEASTPAPSPTVSAPSPSRSPVTYTVGGASNWTVPPNGDAFYKDWAANITFAFGDVLVFNYPNGIHNVAVVTRAAYENCNISSPIYFYSAPPTNITLNSTGEHFFICTVGRHCTLGQKLAINVSATAPAPSPSSSNVPSSPSPQAASPPSPGSATSLSVSGLSATFLSILVALFY